MCLVVLKTTEEQIAEEDLICYKRLNYPRGKIIKSLHKGFEYVLGVLYTQQFSSHVLTGPCGTEKVYCADAKSYNVYHKKPFILLKVYQEGFHSYIDRKRAGHCYQDEIIVECVVPKGTKYIKDSTGLMCSEAIILMEILD